MAFEVFVLLVFLWARTLAARAFPRDPSGEAKALIWIIFASDTFAEMAFVNVEFGSDVFWVMVFMDFAMIVMRDAVRDADSPLQPAGPVAPVECNSSFACRHNTRTCGTSSVRISRGVVASSGANGSASSSR
jgi:hypothetical protein